MEGAYASAPRPLDTAAHFPQHMNGPGHEQLQPTADYPSAPQPLDSYYSPNSQQDPYPTAPQPFNPSAPHAFNPSAPQPFNPNHFHSSPYPTAPFNPAATQPLNNGHNDFAPPEDDFFEGDDLDDKQAPANSANDDMWDGRKMLRVPEAIATIASKGISLKLIGGRYHVIDGPQFEADFQSLRAVRNQRPKKGQRERPFSAMHRFYTLIQGEKWAGTGTIFVAKNEQAQGVGEKRLRSDGSSECFSPSANTDGSPPPQNSGSPGSHAVYPSQPMSPSAESLSRVDSHPQTIAADNVTIYLNEGDNNGHVESVTLQHFLDITGAGDVYRRCMLEKGQAEPSPFLGLNLAEDSIMSKNDLGEALGALWTADSRGDQAYFFKRREGVMPFRNGSIISLQAGEIVADLPLDSENCLYMVVSDRNAKWKGEPIPTPEEEIHGHWCAFLGQVPVVVDGAVRCGDSIGPKGDSSGIGKVTSVDSGPVIGVALQDKPATAAGVVKTLVFAGLNSLHGGSKKDNVVLNQILEQNCLVEKRVFELEDHVFAVQNNLSVVHQEVGNQNGEMATLEERVAGVERQQFWTSKLKKGDAEEGEVSARLIPSVVGMGAVELFFHLKKYHPRFTWSCVLLLAILMISLISVVAVIAADPPSGSPSGSKSPDDTDDTGSTTGTPSDTSTPSDAPPMDPNSPANPKDGTWPNEGITNENCDCCRPVCCLEPGACELVNLHPDIVCCWS